MRTKLESLSPKDRAAFILMEVGLRGFAFVGSCNSDGCVVVRLQRIFPEHQDAVFVRDGVAATGRAIMELGVFGVVLGSGTEVLHNELAGHLVRTKVGARCRWGNAANPHMYTCHQLVGVDEGGVASGYAVLSSPLLTPE